MVSNVLGIGGFLIIPGKRNIVAGVVTGDGTDLGDGMLFVLILGIATIGTSFVARKIAGRRSFRSGSIFINTVHC